MVHHGITMVLFQQGQSVADPEFHNGGQTVEGNGSGEGAVPPPQKKNWIFTWKWWVWCIQGLLFTFIQKLVKSMGGGRPPAPSRSATDRIPCTDARKWQQRETFGPLTTSALLTAILNIGSRTPDCLQKTTCNWFQHVVFVCVCVGQILRLYRSNR